MTTNKFILVVIIQLSIMIFLKGQIPDTLRFSVGYGTTFGGGLGIKYSWGSKKNNLWIYHVGTSLGLLPTTSPKFWGFLDPVGKHFGFVNLYWLLPFRFVFTRFDHVYRNKLIIPFSLNVSYQLNQRNYFSTGFGTIGRLLDTEIRKNSDNETIYIAHLYKIVGINFTYTFHHKTKPEIYSFTLSTILTPLSLGMNKDFISYSLLRYPFRVYTLTFTYEYQYNRKKITKYLKKNKKNVI